MTVTIAVPGEHAVRLEHLVLDVNGTLTNRGELLPGVPTAVGRLSGRLEIRLVSADTFGTLDELSAELGVSAHRVARGADKLALVERLGRARCAVIGNGANDALALEAAALGIAVLGPEGAAAAALRSADVVCRSALDALGLLLEPTALAATLRR